MSLNLRPGVVSFSIAVVLLCQPTWSSAKAFNRNSLSMEERARVDAFVNTDIRADFAEHIDERIQEISTHSDEAHQHALSKGECDMLVKGIYLIIANTLQSKGLPVMSEQSFVRKINRTLAWFSSHGLIPGAITVGMNARTQFGVGAEVGLQFNFYLSNGELRMSGFHVYGAEAGFAEMSKVEFYASLCYGNCYGGPANGYYMGLDSSVGVLVGAGFFLEGGVDLTDAFEKWFQGEQYTLKELYESRAIYAGFGFDVGQGAGASLTLVRFHLSKDLLLAEPGKFLTPEGFSGLKLF